MMRVNQSMSSPGPAKLAGAEPQISQNTVYS